MRSWRKSSGLDKEKHNDLSTTAKRAESKSGNSGAVLNKLRELYLDICFKLARKIKNSFQCCFPPFPHPFLSTVAKRLVPPPSTHSIDTKTGV